jgi:hypothetical protein
MSPGIPCTIIDKHLMQNLNALLTSQPIPCALLQVPEKKIREEAP